MVGQTGPKRGLTKAGCWPTGVWQRGSQAAVRPAKLVDDPRAGGARGFLRPRCVASLDAPHSRPLTARSGLAT